MNDHVASYLSRVKSVIPYLQQAYGLVCYDMEDEDVERVVASIGKEPFQSGIL